MQCLFLPCYQKNTKSFDKLTDYIKAIAERNFGEQIKFPVDYELEELVNSINFMSQKLASHDKAERTFFQNVSHELRTPLMSIQGYAEGIQHALIEPPIAANIIVEESQRMSQLIEELLYLSRLDTIDEHFDYKEVLFNDLLAECIERCYGTAINSKIALKIEYLENEQLILADAAKLSRAIINIINNGIRYAKTTIKIRTYSETDRIILKISDDGPGFEPTELENLFTRFYKGKKGIFGLGLAISQNLIIRHNGTISARNTESGALFTITFPIVPNINY